MSHEIRNPITAALSYMEMLLSTPLRHKRRRSAIEVAQASSALLTPITTILAAVLQDAEFDQDHRLGLGPTPGVLRKRLVALCRIG